jgi:hypothetical protein
MSDTLLTLAELRALRAVVEARADTVRRAEAELERARRSEDAARKRLALAVRRVLGLRGRTVGIGLREYTLAAEEQRGRR